MLFATIIYVMIFDGHVNTEGDLKFFLRIMSVPTTIMNETLAQDYFFFFSLKTTKMLVAIPLTLMQWGIHHANPSIHINLGMIVNNLAMSHAVYDADRIGGEFWDRKRWSTSLAAFGSATYFALDPHTIALSPVVVGLSAHYADFKPRIAEWKPAFVATMWAVAVACAPAWRAHVAPDALTTFAVFASIAALSHVQDIDDIEEDEAEGIRTPAVVMGREEAARYGIAATIVAAYVHQLSPAAWWPYDYVCLSYVAGLAVESNVLFGALLALASATYAGTHTDDLVVAILKSTDVPHRMSISAMANIVHVSSHLPAHMRKDFVDCIMDIMQRGDDMGRGLLRVYREVLRNSV